MAEERGPAGHYRLSPRDIPRVLLAILLGQRRDLGPDIRGTLARARPRPRVIDQHNIPEEGPFVFVTNHYERPGLEGFWGGMLAANALYERRPPPRTPRWLLTRGGAQICPG